MMLYAAVFLAGASSLSGQAGPGWDPAGLQLTRVELEQMLERFEMTSNEPAYSEALRRQAREEAEMIRQRLREGDLRAGDRIALIVEGFEALSDTFNIVANRSIILPEIGPVPLAGVLRSELQDHLTTHITRFINNPVVHARSLVRLQILGAVLRPGFYTVPSDVLVGDALMQAGGPLPNAQLDRITIERGDEQIWSAERMREAIIEGRTLDQLSIRAGDGIHVPQQSNRFDLVRNGIIVLTGLASLVAIAAQAGVF
jgi:protein involved in polysaccharide export with SLBB domain